jgi:hypothetical protein
MVGKLKKKTMKQEDLNAMMKWPSESASRQAVQLSKCPKCGERYSGNGKALCVDCDWIERAKTPGYALRATLSPAATEATKEKQS